MHGQTPVRWTSQMNHGLQCQCGAFRGYIKNPKAGSRVICYCRDCQAFAHFLNRAEDILDSQGAGDIVQVSPSKLVFTQGKDLLTNMKLTEAGMLRWYTRCCNTPVGNTPANYKVAFVGLARICLVGDRDDITRTFGPVAIRSSSKSAKGQVPRNSPRMIFAIGHFFSLLVGGLLRGSYRRTPFFHSANGHPVVSPKPLSTQELQNIKARLLLPPSV